MIQQATVEYYGISIPCGYVLQKSAQFVMRRAFVPRAYSIVAGSQKFGSIRPPVWLRLKVMPPCGVARENCRNGTLVET